MSIRISAIAVAAILVARVAGAEPVPLTNSNALWFENWTGLSNATLVVSNPEGEISRIESATGTPVFRLTGARVPDGRWDYELRAATDERRRIVNPIDNGRGEAARDTVAVGYTMTGAFFVSGGVIVQPDDRVEE